MGQVGSALAVTIAVVATAIHPQDAARTAPKSPTQPAAAQTASRPPPPTTIAGLRGFESVSALVLATAPETPRELRATYAFPDRVRWMISSHGTSGLERSIQYRFGSAAYQIPAGTDRSEECAGEERDKLFLQMELRRALMLFPDGFEWKKDGVESTASLGDLGVLRARFASAADATPSEVVSVDSHQHVIDAFRSITWKESGGRRWPASMEHWQAEKLLWKETVSAVETGARTIDDYFLPPDRRDLRGSQPVGGAIRELDLPPTCALRVELARAATTWQAALAELERQRAAWTEKLAAAGLRLDPNATFELSDAGVPEACFLRLATVPTSPPSGFETTVTRKGRATALQGVAAVNVERMRELSRSVPRGSVAGRAYVRFAPADAAAGHVLLVVPYVEAR